MLGEYIIKTKDKHIHKDYIEKLNKICEGFYHSQQKNEFIHVKDMDINYIKNAIAKTKKKINAMDHVLLYPITLSVLETELNNRSFNP